MNLAIRREPSASGSTIGELFVDGSAVRLAWTLEDPVREILGQPVESWKIQDDTAIPAGRYRIAITVSDRFKRRMIRLLNVPGFAGILVHAGNTSKDTDGCILVGLDRQGSMIYKSRTALEDRIYPMLEEALLAAEEVWLSVG